VASVPALPAAAALWLVHREAAGTASERAQFRAECADRAVVLETCLRRLAVGSGDPPPLAGELLTGAAAYARLLEVVSGLRSAVVGETNVAGQFRRAWADAATALPGGLRAALEPVATAALADAASVRRAHLEGLGGSSWGTLVRRLLVPAAGARVLLVGAGDLAGSIAPYLGRVTLGLWNRHALDADRARALPAVRDWFAPDAADHAAAWADIAILTTPADVAHDAAWLARFAARATPLAAGVHLGQREPTAFRWPDGVRGYLLDDVLALADRQHQRRGAAVAAARQLCATLADRRCPAPDRRARA
jgi:hypothetical protein